MLGWRLFDDTMFKFENLNDVYLEIYMFYLGKDNIDIKYWKLWKTQLFKIITKTVKIYGITSIYYTFKHGLLKDTDVPSDLLLFLYKLH